MSPCQQAYYQHVSAMLERIFVTQSASIAQAAQLFAGCVQQQGVIYGFGSGHSFAAALELAGRAGGLVNTKAIDHFYGQMGWFDALKGSGELFAGLLDLRPQDCLVMVSHSGTRPLHMELAHKAKQQGVRLVVISRNAASAAGSIREIADVVIDNCSPEDDCTLSLDRDTIRTGPVTSLSAAFIINNIVIRCIELLLEQGREPPVMRSIHLPDGKARNEALIRQYRERMFSLY